MTESSRFSVFNLSSIFQAKSKSLHNAAAFVYLCFQFNLHHCWWKFWLSTCIFTCISSMPMLCLFWVDPTSFFFNLINYNLMYLSIFSLNQIVLVLKYTYTNHHTFLFILMFFMKFIKEMLFLSQVIFSFKTIPNNFPLLVSVHTKSH